MKIKQFEVWIADLNPRFGTETGKTRPVAIIQTNLLNKFHPSTIVCPLTTNIMLKASILRVHLPKETAKLKEARDIMIDQIRAIDNKTLLKRIGDLPKLKLPLLRQIWLSFSIFTLVRFYSSMHSRSLV